MLEWIPKADNRSREEDSLQDVPTISKEYVQIGWQLPRAEKLHAFRAGLCPAGDET